MTYVAQKGKTNLMLNIQEIWEKKKIGAGWNEERREKIDHR